MSKSIFLLFCAGLLAAASCKKAEEYPIIPAISFKDLYSTRDSLGHDAFLTVKITLTDGDGDIGYYSVESHKNDPIFDDANSQYYHNFRIDSWHKVFGVWTLSPTDISSRIPYLTPDTKNKALKCEIEVTPVVLNVGLVNDTTRYEIFIYDRALHKSNVITTPEIIINS